RAIESLVRQGRIAVESADGRCLRVPAERRAERGSLYFRLRDAPTPSMRGTNLRVVPDDTTVRDRYIPVVSHRTTQPGGEAGPLQERAVPTDEKGQRIEAEKECIRQRLAMLSQRR